MGHAGSRSRISGRGREAQASRPERLARTGQHHGLALRLGGRYHTGTKGLGESYTLTGKVIGKGSSGGIRLATGPDGAGKYAVKSFSLCDLSPDTAAALEMEVEIFLGMDHPHVARLIDVYESETELHLVMEYLEGGSLFDQLCERKVFQEKDAAGAVQQMLSAIAYIHGRGVVHRDIKLENWVYEQKGGDHLKLIDFGISTVKKRRGAMMDLCCGTAAYMAPEVIRKAYTEKCDVWSLGVVTFMLLAGYMPFQVSQDASTEDQLRSILLGEFCIRPDRWKDVSELALDFVGKLLTVDPLVRLSASSALDHPWIAEWGQRENGRMGLHHLQALRTFSEASAFRRAAMGMLAWSLSADEMRQAGSLFVDLSGRSTGGIALDEMRRVLEEDLRVPQAEATVILASLTDGRHVVRYSDFLAAVAVPQLEMQDDRIDQAFRRFDVCHASKVTLESLKEVLGDSFEGTEVGDVFAEVPRRSEGEISAGEFRSYLRRGWPHGGLGTLPPGADADASSSDEWPRASRGATVQRPRAEIYEWDVPDEWDVPQETDDYEFSRVPSHEQGWSSRTMLEGNVAFLPGVKLSRPAFPRGESDDVPESPRDLHDPATTLGKVDLARRTSKASLCSMDSQQSTVDTLSGWDRQFPASSLGWEHQASAS